MEDNSIEAFALSSAISFPTIPACPGIQQKITKTLDFLTLIQAPGFPLPAHI